MSAYIVEPASIRAIVESLKSDKNNLGLYQETEEEIVELLYRENQKSVAYRYKEKENGNISDYIKRVKNGGWEKLYFHDMKPLQIIKLIHCWKYQTCEHPNHENSRAWKIMSILENNLIRNIPEYKNADFGIKAWPKTEVKSVFGGR